MNKEEIEKRYDDIFGKKHYTICDEKSGECHKEVKTFIFNEIITEVLGSVLHGELNIMDAGDSREQCWAEGHNAHLEETKQKAKELYGINL